MTSRLGPTVEVNIECPNNTQIWLHILRKEAKKGLFSVPKPCLLSFVMSLNRSSIKFCLLMKMLSESKSSSITPWAMTDPFLLNRLLLYFLLGWSILKLLLHTICSEKRLMMMDKLQHSIAFASQIFQRCQIPTIIKVLRQLK